MNSQAAHKIHFYETGQQNAHRAERWRPVLTAKGRTSGRVGRNLRCSRQGNGEIPSEHECALQYCHDLYHLQADFNELHDAQRAVQHILLSLPEAEEIPRLSSVKYPSATEPPVRQDIQMPDALKHPLQPPLSVSTDAIRAGKDLDKTLTLDADETLYDQTATSQP